MNTLAEILEKKNEQRESQIERPLSFYLFIILSKKNERFNGD